MKPNPYTRGKLSDFDFSTALKYLKRGFILTRRKWDPHPGARLFLDIESQYHPKAVAPKFYRIFPPDTQAFPYRATNEDLLANDWRKTFDTLDVLMDN